MYMEKQDIDQLVIAFLNHSISEEDAECLFMWVNEKEENKQYLLSYQKVNLATTFRKQSKYSSNQAYLQFLKRQKNMQTQVFVHRLRSFMKYAAVLFICAFIGFNFYNYLGTNVHKAEEFIVCVPNSKHSFFYLSDSTEVWLNSGSEFKYTSDYGTKNREVYLKGEAYFNVRKNQQLPFLVKTDSVSVRVYGTKFSIRNYSDMETVKIALQEGQIALNLESENDQLFVKPEEEIIVAPFDGEITSVVDTGHAVGLTSSDGVELLIHVGVDTVKMQGDGFQVFVTEGQKVKTGEKLLKFDRDKIRKAGYSDTTAVLVTNSDDYSSVKTVAENVKQKDTVIIIEK